MHPVLLDEIGDHLRLLAADPAGEGSQEEMKMDGFNHPASVSDDPQGVVSQRGRVFGHYAYNTAADSNYLSGLTCLHRSIHILLAKRGSARTS